METNQQNIDTITNIKVSGIASMGYWSILKTQDAIYFIRSDSTPRLGTGIFYPVIASAVRDVIESRKAKDVAKKDLSTVLSEAEQSLKFTREQYGLLEMKKGIFGGGSVKVPNGKEKSWKEAGYVKLKLSRKQFKIFLAMLQN